MRILLTNDDGIDAPGLAALHRALTGLGELVVVAPATPQSATSHGVTYHRPMPLWRHVIEENEDGHRFAGMAVDGKPADCVKVAFAALLNEPVDLVVSGINAGANVGVSVLYSGTVAAAREAVLQGVPAIAVSLHIGDPQRTRWSVAADQIAQLMPSLLSAGVQPPQMLNVNFPVSDDDRPSRGVRVCPAATSPYLDRYHDTVDPAGQRMFEAFDGMAYRDMPEGCDVRLLFDHWTTITPLTVDTTAHEAMDALSAGFAADAPR